MPTHPNVPPPGALGDVDPDVLELLDRCRVELSPRQGELVLAVHQRLLELIPAISRMPGSGRAMCQELVVVTLRTIDSGLPRAAAAAAARQAGAEAYRDGFLPARHDTVVHVMLHAVRAHVDQEWSSGLSSAWVAHLIWMRAQLTVGAEEQRALQPTHDGLPAEARAPGGGTADVDPFGVPIRPGAGVASPPSVTLEDDLDHPDDEGDEEEPGYGSLMMSMTLGGKRSGRRHRD